MALCSLESAVAGEDVAKCGACLHRPRLLLFGNDVDRSGNLCVRQHSQH